jgi:type IV fimbrial biogenesis protein FimT
MKNYRSNRRWNRGITLVETMVTVTIMAVLLTLAMPSYRSSIESNQRTTYANQLVEDLNLARSEAIKRNTTVTVCPSTDGSSCTGGRSWSGGWLVFVDKDSSRDVNNGETVLRVHEALKLPSGWTAVHNAKNYVLLNPTGEFDGVGATGFRICIMLSTDGCNDDGIAAALHYSNIVVKAPARTRIETK